MIKVLVIDDSALVRQLLSHMLSQAADIEVVGCAEDPYQAREMIKQLRPHVLTLDIEMPKMDGLAFLRNLMRLRPMPVIMVSTLTEQGASATLEALALGAIDFIPKPKNDLANRLKDYQDELTDKIRLAAKSKAQIPAQLPKLVPPIKDQFQDSILAIGASTGGTEAIQRIISQLPANSPPIVIAQHIPPAFSASFAKRLNGYTDIKVIEAKGSEQLLPGHAYLAPGNVHLAVQRRGRNYYTQIIDTEPVNRHKPSVDVLFNSIAECVGITSLGLILTGMGKDGAQGLLAMKKMGAHTLAQDEASSVVWGMPGAAVAIEAHCEQISIDNIPNRLLALMRQK